MFKVECPGCQAPYQVDERRVPAAGLRMRCPKCGNTFPVSKPGESTPTALLGGTPAKPPARNPQQLKGTMIGMAAQGAGRPPPPRRERRQDSTVIGVPAPAVTKPAARTDKPPTLGGPSGGFALRSTVPVAENAPEAKHDDDLPAVFGGAGSAAKRASVASNPAAQAVSKASRPDIDQVLPAVRTEKSARAEKTEKPKQSALSLELEASFAAVAPNASRPVSLPGLKIPEPFELPLEPPPPVETKAPFDLPSPRRDFGTELRQDLAFDDVGFGEVDLPSVAPLGKSARPDPLERIPTGVGAPGGARSGLGEGPRTNSLRTGRGAASDPHGQLSLDAPLTTTTKTSRPPSLPAVNPFDDPFSLPELDAVRTGTSGQKSFSASFPGFEVPRPAAPEPPKSPPPAPAVTEDPFADMAEFDAPLASSPPPASDTAARSRGGAQYGEVDLGGGSDVDLDGEQGSSGLDTDDGMEFGAIPQEAPAPAAPSTAAASGAAFAAESAGPAAPQSAGNSASQASLQSAQMAIPAPVLAGRAGEGPRRAPSPQPAKRSRGLLIGAGVVLFLGIAGGALALVPELGPYGIYFIGDLTQASANERRLDELHAEVTKARANDDDAASRAALKRVEAAHKSAPRYRPFAAYLAFGLYSHMLRFGDDPALQAQAKVLLDGLEGVEPVPFELDAARAGERTLANDLVKARTRLQKLVASRPKSVELWAALGELELRAGDAAKAKEAWEKAQKLADNSWTRFGASRAAARLGDVKLAREGANNVLEQRPEHTGARLLLAELAWNDKDEATAVAELEKVLSTKTARGDEIAARIQLGELHLGRGRLSKAEAEFTAALGIQAQNARALCGLGDTFFQAGRYTAALARYEAAVTAEPNSLGARIGVARTLIPLDRLKDAEEGLAKLQSEHPGSADVAYWLGRATEASGKRDAAKAAYRNSIKLATEGDGAARSYVALVQLLRQEGALEEATTLLSEALAKLPASALLRKAQGEVLLTQGRYDEALGELEAARKLEPANVAILFDIAVCQRKLGNIQQAFTTLEEVAKLDPQLPGLPLERGLLLEVSGKSGEALKEYEAALAKAPDDPDLMLRVGCARVAAGQGKDAQATLEHVLVKRPRSSDAHFCLGRAFLVQEKLLEAMQNLRRATELDPNRAEYFVYVARAANAAGQVGVAQQAIDSALVLDQGFADAFWQKGVLLLRQGAALDALAAFDKALQLRPTLYEAHADRAQAYYQVGREVEALDEWEKALRHDGKNATWHFRYGKLLAARRLNQQALPHLLGAVEAGEKMDPKPTWLWQAHQLAATTLGPTAAALPHWRKFLELSPDNSPYRDEAKQALARAGQAYTGP